MGSLCLQCKLPKEINEQADDSCHERTDLILNQNLSSKLLRICHCRVCTRIYFSFATIFANQIFFVPFSRT